MDVITEVDGQTVTEVKASASVLKLIPGDVFVLNIEVGKMPQEKVSQRQRDIIEMMRRVIPEGVKILVIPMVEGKPTVDIKAVRFEKFDVR